MLRNEVLFACLFLKTKMQAFQESLAVYRYTCEPETSLLEQRRCFGDTTGTV